MSAPVIAPSAALAVAEPLVLPIPPQPEPRAPIPLAAFLVPIAGAGVMWLVTGSAAMLLFAGLGPLMALAALADRARAARRARIRGDAELSAARERIAGRLAQLHADERAEAWRRHPDVAVCLARPEVVWRAKASAREGLVVGSGTQPSAARVAGGGDDPESLRLRALAASVEEAPVSVSPALGICVIGPRVAALAVARALVVQLCLRMPPEELAIVAVPRGETWAARLPHRRTTGSGSLRLAFTAPGESVPDADLVVATAVPGAPIPARCGALLILERGSTGTLEEPGVVVPVRVEAVSAAQAHEIAVDLAARHVVTAGTSMHEAVPLAALLRDAVSTVGLSVPIGVEGTTPIVVDLIEDGPHAVVAGVTGSGKSELLITWITALCATRTTSEVSFLLADFKGGSAFDTLTALPHVTGVLTDLDAAAARRAIDSLSAEVRRRETALAAVGARDIRDPRVQLPRLVIVVDEFAALLAEHPALHAVFVDVAARGRALGMHLVLGTQRVSGILRDALLANCPLRISLRVTDPADSRAVIGTDEAARLPGDAASRGLACIRRAGDPVPRLTRIALTAPGDITAALTGAAGQSRPHRPWHPVLPAHLTLSALCGPVDPHDGHRSGERLLVGLIDEPERQRQTPFALTVGVDRGLVAVGGPGSGRTNLVDLVHAQAEGARVVRIGPDLEQAWDAVAAIDAMPRSCLLLLDDLDVLLTAYPPEHALVFAARLERIVRAAPAAKTTIVVTAQRITGAAARIAELIPRRMILPHPSRIDHVAAGGDARAFDPTAPPGRGEIAGAVLQVALADAPMQGPHADSAPPWHPSSAVTAFVSRSPARAAASLVAALPAARVLLLADLAQGAGIPAAAESAATVIVGDGESWQRHWSLIGAIRADHEIVFEQACASDLRALTGDREPPPFAIPGRGRAWVVRAGRPVARVTLAAGADC